MLSIHNLYKSYGIQPILQNINFNISAGERIGLIGPNGSGKTTLMRILAGIENPDPGLSLRRAHQEWISCPGMTFDEEQTLQLTSACIPFHKLTSNLRSHPSPLHYPQTQTMPHFKKNTIRRSHISPLSTHHSLTSSPLSASQEFPSPHPSPTSAADKRLVSCWRAFC
jgi:energy-coupling factor transporter ATP-binding protein EcfA2